MNDDTQPGLTPDAVERYERSTRIASGGMGEVWRARDNVLGREVAVKILKREFADDLTFRARFAAEARHAAGLHHPGIAAVFDYGLLQDAETPYLVMELVDGKPLSDLLAGGTPVDPEQARLLALQTAEALAVAHAAGVVHRDVKPGNLLVTPDGRVKITDFGIARATGSVAFTQTGQIVGTPHYLSPEQARGNSATAASDVYALGVVLFECLSGHRPFTADTPIATALAQIQQETPPLPDSVPPALARVVEHALAKDPTQRYADGQALAEALRGAAPGATPTAAPVAAAVAPPTESTRVLRTGTLPAAAGLGAAGAGAAAADPHPTPPETPAPGADDPSGQKSRRGLWIVGGLVLLLLVALLVLHPWTDDSSPTDDGTDPTAEAGTVRVRKAAFVGDPVADVEKRLRARGLQTTTDTIENDGTHEAGTVGDLSPTGVVDKGTTITLQVWGGAPAEEDQPTPSDTPSPDEQQTDEPSDGGGGGGNDNGNPGQGNTEKPTKPTETADPGQGQTGGASPGPDAGPDAGATTGAGADKVEPGKVKAPSDQQSKRSGG